MPVRKDVREAQGQAGSGPTHKGAKRRGRENKGVRSKRESNIGVGGFGGRKGFCAPREGVSTSLKPPAKDRVRVETPLHKKP